MELPHPAPYILTLMIIGALLPIGPLMKIGQRVHNRPVDTDEPELDSDEAVYRCHNSSNSVVPALDSSFALSSAITSTNRPNGLANTAEHVRKVTHGEPVINSSIESEPDKLHREINQSRQPSTRPSLANSPPLLAHNLSHDPASAASNSYRHPAACHDAMVNMIVADTGDALADMPVVDAGPESGPAATLQASSGGYSIPSSTALSAEMDIVSPL
ncbi:hypothetical protein B9Z19DRAFT_1069142 [Tuber borchii]|uniref:Uncharacterized protein n=1 Tax=Tuber borchii TaxID=42251 RepID=A0A2T6ZCS4_TUBBO|nr:hypothetical protein B9Z19DRAFT_1069142 [Tuber borchii]